ncbi:MAG: SHOCT domain-containing protein [Desulfobacula sp.]|nr:SHOCT domain-containing protein [Desulfobacula sp.]
MIFKNLNKSGLFKSIFTAYCILLLHVVLLAGIGVTIILFKGLYQYLPWVMGGIALLVMAISGFLYQRMKNSSAQIKDILAMPQFHGRTVEIKLLGGIASFKIAPDTHKQTLIDNNSSNTLMIENDINKTEQQILRLTTLFKKDIISKKEFDKAKQDIIQG